MVVFIAWPALQNSQKDSALRQDGAQVVRAIESFKVDNISGINGVYPANQDGQIWWPNGGNDGKLGAYVGKLSTAKYILLGLGRTDINTRPIGSDINIYNGFSCNGSGLKLDSVDSFVVMIKLTGGNRFACLDAY